MKAITQPHANDVPMVHEHIEMTAPPDAFSNARALARMRSGIHYDQTPAELAESFWFLTAPDRPPQPGESVRWQRSLPSRRTERSPRPRPVGGQANDARPPTWVDWPRVTMCITRPTAEAS